jgi:alkaline phosphatase D
MRRALALFLALTAAARAVLGQPDPSSINRIAFGSCNREYRPQSIWKAIGESRPDLWIWLGDVVYGTAKNLPDLKRRYDLQKNSPAYKGLREHCRIVGVWDDNDYGMSDGGKENPHKVESQKLLLDFLDEPADSQRRRQPGVYASYLFGSLGQRVRIILLDCRYNRERPGAKSDMLGADQWRWLEQQLNAGDGEVTLIGSSIQVIAEEHPFEKWASFPQSRKRLLDLVASSKARNVIFLSGDRHLGEISRLTDPRFPYPLYDITSSGLTHHAEDSWLHSFTHEMNRYRVGTNFVGLNFGVIEFDWHSAPATATLQIRDATNAIKVEEKVTLTPP